MACFVITLAKLLDGLCAGDKAHLTEYETFLVVSGVDFKNTKEVIDLLMPLGWRFEISDSEESLWDAEQIFEEAAPFKISITKPTPQLSSVNILTNAGLDQLLRSGCHEKTMAVASLAVSFKTKAQLFCPWGSSESFAASESTKSPRALVKENAGTRKAPKNINPWLLQDIDSANFNDPAFCVWANIAIDFNVVSLANEICLDDLKVKFKGPPKLSLEYPIKSPNYIGELTADGFVKLQEAVTWVYENEREAEVKHALLSNEISRSGRELDSTLTYFRKHISDSLDSARITYQVSISDVGKETIKTLTDLRKAVAEEVSKVADSTRQIITSIAGSLAVSIGLIAAKVASDKFPELIIKAVMIVVLAHVVAIILSGVGYIRIQRNLRLNWQPRLYRFLPSAEYKCMVDDPIKNTENYFFLISLIGFFATLILAGVVFFGNNYQVGVDDADQRKEYRHSVVGVGVLEETIKAIQEIRDIESADDTVAQKYNSGNSLDVK